MKYFSILEDEQKKGMWFIIFGSGREIDEGEIYGDGIPDNINELIDTFQDTGAGCEDYLIHTKIEPSEIRSILSGLIAEILATEYGSGELHSILILTQVKPSVKTQTPCHLLFALQD